MCIPLPCDLYLAAIVGRNHVKFLRLTETENLSSKKSQGLLSLAVVAGALRFDNRGR